MLPLTQIGFHDDAGGGGIGQRLARVLRPAAQILHPVIGQLCILHGFPPEFIYFIVFPAAVWVNERHFAFHTDISAWIQSLQSIQGSDAHNRAFPFRDPALVNATCLILVLLIFHQWQDAKCEEVKKI